MTVCKMRNRRNFTYAIVANMENAQPINDCWPFYFNFSVNLTEDLSQASIISVDKANAINTLSGNLFDIEIVKVV